MINHPITIAMRAYAIRNGLTAAQICNTNRQQVEIVLKRSTSYMNDVEFVNAIEVLANEVQTVEKEAELVSDKQFVRNKIFDAEFIARFPSVKFEVERDAVRGRVLHIYFDG